MYKLICITVLFLAVFTFASCGYIRKYADPDKNAPVYIEDREHHWGAMPHIK